MISGITNYEEAQYMDYTFTVKRSRQSVTQGTATVYLNGAELISFGDTIEMVKPGIPHYGENIGGWASIVPDGDFVHGVLFHPHETLYHHSKKVREMLKCDGRPVPEAIKPARQAKEGRMYIDIDAKIAAAPTQEEKDAWESERAILEKLDIDFCAGWHVGIYKQACGHWEILQSPVYGHHMLVAGKPYTAADADRELREASALRSCTRCICAR